MVERIAQEEGLKVEQKDIMEHTTRMAMMYGIAPNQLFEEMRKNPNSYAAMAQQIMAAKVNDLLLEKNTFKAK